MANDRSNPNGHATLIVDNGVVVTMNDRREIIGDGAVAIDGDRIVAVGKRDAVRSAYDAADTLDARGAVIIPGLIDGHNHTYNNFVGGLGDDMPVKDMLYEVFYPYETYLTEDEAHLAARCSMLEMIRSGVTCFNDPGGYAPEAVCRAAVDTGIRGIVTRSTRDMGENLPDNLVGDTDTNLREGERLVKSWNGAAEGRVRAWFGIRMPTTASDDLVTGIRDLARQHGVGIHAHVSTVEWENVMSTRIFGKRTLARYRELGILGPNLYAAHMGDVTDEEQEWVKEADVKVTHTVVAAMTQAWGIIKKGRIPKLMKAGVTMSLGSDTGFQSGCNDFFRQMFICATVHRDISDDPGLVGAYKTFEMATIDGARACLWDDEIGSLEPGKKADLVLVDPSGPGWAYPARDPVRSLVYATNCNNVDTVLIDGKVVMKDREIQTIDEDRNRAMAAEAGRAWMARAGISESAKAAWPVV